MSELARAGRTLERVLEIGTGCGYQTAVLARIAGEVYTVERIGALVDEGAAQPAVAQAQERAADARRRHGGPGRGSRGATRSSSLPARRTCRTSLLKYLKPGGRMVLPLAQHGDERRRRAAAHRDRRRRPTAAGSRLSMR